jgi:hypothetical protein
MRNSAAIPVIGYQELALGFQIAFANAIYNRFKVASSTGSHHANFKHGAKIEKLSSRNGKEPNLPRQKLPGS